MTIEVQPSGDAAGSGTECACGGSASGDPRLETEMMGPGVSLPRCLWDDASE